MNLISHYEKLCSEGKIQSDPHQLDSLPLFQRVHDDLLESQRKRTSLLHRFRKPALVKGLYIYGGVGTGKSFLMDMFYNQLPFQGKLRLHFHAFMQYIHHELKRYQGKSDPLKVVADSLAKQYYVICFDEFVVTDIVDAMLLKNLLDALFSRGVCFVATSNTAPDDLYKNGLQRTSFIPAIALLKEHMVVHHIPGQQDYRALQLQKSGVFFDSRYNNGHEEMEKIFALLSHDADVDVDPVFINSRYIEVMKRTNKLVWFHFKDLCQPPRSQQDYLTLAKVYKTVFLSNVPVFNRNDKNTVILFIKLIDVLYDARIPLVLSSSRPIDELGKYIQHIPEYARTESRLQEMQSEKYFTQQMLNV